MTGVVVAGVDGSEQALAALRFAIDEARLRDARLRVVHVWMVPHAAFAAGMPVANVNLFDDVEKAAEQTLDEALGAVAGETAGLDVERVVVQGPTAHELIEAAKGADLLVVGSRGRGGFAGLLLGSVSHQCAIHARCPVAIVPPERE